METNISPRFGRQRSLVAVTCLTLTLAVMGCRKGPPPVHTLQTVTVEFGTSSQKEGDPTAVTTIFPGSPSASDICFASGGSQPPLPPPGIGGQCSSSPAPGESIFSRYASGPQYPFHFFSGVCSLTPGRPFEASVTLGPTAGKYEWNVCSIPAFALPGADNHFATTDQLPPTVTVNGSGLSSTYGWPELFVYDGRANIVGNAIATSVATDGSSATFPFPRTTSGGSLSSDTYMFAVKNFTDSSGRFRFPTATYFSLGGTTGLAGAFGVDAADITTYVWQCTPDERMRCVPGSTTSQTVTSPIPMVTQYYANLVSYDGHTMPTGSQPVAIKKYGSITLTLENEPTFIHRKTVPKNAVVVNSGSNSVTILDLVNYSTVATIGVGVQPLGVTVNAGAMKAYVANYGSGTLSEVDLSALNVSRTANVGTGAQSVAMDPGGSAVWVGGSGYLKKVDLTTFTMVATISVNGSVSSLAASNQQNELVYTLVDGCCSGSSSAAVKELSLSSFATTGTYASMSANPYAAYTMNGSLATPSAIPDATQVSVQWGNGLGASATPTGFVVYDLVSHREIMSGSTSTPVRGIASNPSNTVVYFTVPDSNKYITVPLPHL